MNIWKAVVQRLVVETKRQPAPQERLVRVVTLCCVDLMHGPLSRLGPLERGSVHVRDLRKEIEEDANDGKRRDGENQTVGSNCEEEQSKTREIGKSNLSTLFAMDPSDGLLSPDGLRPHFER